MKCGVTLCMLVKSGFVNRLCACMPGCLCARPRVLRKQSPSGHGCVHLPSPDPAPVGPYWAAVVVVVFADVPEGSFIVTARAEHYPILPDKPNRTEPNKS